MPFGDYFKLPEGFKAPRSAPNRMEGLNAGQKLNYMGQFEGPSLMALGAGIMSGEPEQGWSDMAKLQAGYQANYAGEQEENRVRQQTMQYLLANGIDPAQAEAASQNPAILRHIFDLQEQQARVDAGGSDQNMFQPILMKRADGSYYYASPDPNKRQLVPYESAPGDVPVDPGMRAEEVAGGKVVGEFDAKQSVTAPMVISDSQRALGLLQEIKRDSNAAWGTGLSSIANAAPGSPGYDFAARVKQANATTMTQAISKLQGLGSMSEAEFRGAMASISRMEVATSKGEFDKALVDYENYLNYSIQIARMKAARAGVQLYPDYPQAGGAVPPPAAGGGGGGGGGTVAPPADPAGIR